MFESNIQLNTYVKKHLLKTSVDDDLILIYSDYDNKQTDSDIYKTIIVDKESLKIVFISHKKILYDDFTKISKMELSAHPRLIVESLEGSSIYLYYHKNMWRTSTRSKIKASECIWKAKKSLHDLMLDTISCDADNHLDAWETFCSKHDPNKVYTYNIVHHENKHIIDYSYRFGESYKKLHLLNSRCMHTQKLVINEPCIDHINVIPSTMYDDYSILDTMNTEEYYIEHSSNIKYEGICVTDLITEDIIKITTNCYRIAKLYNKVKHPRSAEHYIQLYQCNLMDTYFNKFSSESFHNLYPIKAIVHDIFTILTNYIYNLVHELYDPNNKYTALQTKSLQYHSLSYSVKKILCMLRKQLYRKKDQTINKNNVYYTLKHVNSTDIINAFMESVSKFRSNSKIDYDIIISYIQIASEY
jgi:hypothetical protein